MDNFTDLLEQLKEDEGFVPHAYEDHLGYITVGYGTMIDKRKNGGITKGEAEFLLNSRVQKIYLELHDSLPWLHDQPESIKLALANMAYQMGVNGVLNFKNTLRFIRQGEYKEAANEAMDSKWSKQTPSRALRIAKIIGEAHA